MPLASSVSDNLRGLGRRRINRAPSRTLAIAVPWLVVMLGSLLPTWLFITSAPLVPPLGFLLLVAWQQLRPGTLPVWAGLPLGLFDDLYSGQPFGSAILLWSLSLVALDLLEVRFPWRGVMLNWIGASCFVVLYILLGSQLAAWGGMQQDLLSLVPQVIFSIIAYPIAATIVGVADRFRLIPVRKL